MSDTIGIYLHIPFCKSKCPYCDFFSGKATQTDYDRYTDILKSSIIYWSGQTYKKVSTVYFGGGTPSVLGADRLSKLLKTLQNSFEVLPDAEITVEVNPDTGKSLDFEKLKRTGFNRISVGFQTAIERELQALGRIHTAGDALVTTKNAKVAGIDNVSLDLMMGIPYQTRESLKESIDFCASCGVKHISSYLLKIEEGTHFDKIKSQLSLADDEEQAKLYLFAVEYLEKLGYKQYEISNFAKPGFESRHNTLYWRLDDYIGIGPSAHSFLDGKRFYYPRSMEEFLNGSVIDDGTGGDEKEFIMLSLRLKSGLDYSSYENRFARPLPRRVLDSVERFTSLGYMESDGSHASLTPKGFLISNYIISELTEE